MLGIGKNKNLRWLDMLRVRKGPGRYVFCYGCSISNPVIIMGGETTDGDLAPVVLQIPH